MTGKCNKALPKIKNPCERRNKMKISKHIKIDKASIYVNKSHYIYPHIHDMRHWSDMAKICDIAPNNVYYWHVKVYDDSMMKVVVSKYPMPNSHQAVADDYMMSKNVIS